MTSGRGHDGPGPARFRVGLMALALVAGAPFAADRGTVRWTTPATALRSVDARFADPQPLLYLYRRDGDHALIRLVDRPQGLATVAAATAALSQPVDLAPLRRRTRPDRPDVVLFEPARTPSGPAGTLRLLDPAADWPAQTDPLPGRPLGLLELTRAGSPRLLAVSLGNDDRLILTGVPEDGAAGLVVLGFAAPPDPWAAVALPARNRPGVDRPAVDRPAVDRPGVDRPAVDPFADSSGGHGAPDLAVLGVEGDGRIVARLVDTERGVTGSALAFGRRLTPVDAVALPDVYPDVYPGGSPELAVLGETDDGRVAGILIKETGSGATVGRFRLSPSYQPLALHHLPAGGSRRAELLVVGLRANGALGLQRRALADGQPGRAGPTLPLKARYVPTDTALLRLGEEGRIVLALAGADWRGQFRLEVRDAVSGALLLDRALP